MWGCRLHEIVDDLDLALGDRRGRATRTAPVLGLGEPFERRATPFNSADAVAGSWRRDRALATGCTAALLDAGRHRCWSPRPCMVWLYEPAGQTALHGRRCDPRLRRSRGGPARATATTSSGRSAARVPACSRRAGLVGVVVLVLASYALKAEVSRFLVFVGRPRRRRSSRCSPGCVPAPVAARGRGTRRRGDDAHARRRRAAARSPAWSRDLRGATRPRLPAWSVCACPSVDDERPSAGVPMLGAVARRPAGGRRPRGRRRRRRGLVHRRRRRCGGCRGRWTAPARSSSWPPDLVEVIAARGCTCGRPRGLSLLEVEVGRAARPDGRQDRARPHARRPDPAGRARRSSWRAALAVRLTSPGPAFYRQTRIGVDGAEFTMWKLRTHVRRRRRAPRRAARARATATALLFKMRARPAGHPGRPGAAPVLARRAARSCSTSSRGDMSLVGPRPPLAEEVAAYPDAVHRRLRVRPGLTGLWQVSRPLRPVVGGVGAARPALRRQLVRDHGPADPVEDRPGRAATQRCLLTDRPRPRHRPHP